MPDEPHDAAVRRVAAAYSERFRYSSARYYLWQKFPALEAVEEKISSHNPVLHDDPWVLDSMSPSSGERLLDLGCGMSLAAGHFRNWHCDYYGCDICPELIRANAGLVCKNVGVRIMGLAVTDGLALPWRSSYFHLACCIGVVEYYPPSFAQLLLSELKRVCSPGARIFTNIPNMRHEYAREMCLIEEARGCPNFPWRRDEFERLASQAGFSVVKRLDTYLMISYILQAQ